MSITCVPIYGLMFRILTRFHAFYFTLARRVFIAILFFDTGKAGAKDFAGLVFTENAHFQ